MVTMYRVTRPNVYSPNTPGHTNPSARQGYYVKAKSPEEAVNNLRTRWRTEEKGIFAMSEKEIQQPLDVQVWESFEDGFKTID